MELEYALTDLQRTFYPGDLPKGDIMWNQAVCVTFDAAYPYDRLNGALNLLAERSDQLRLRIARHGSEPYAYIEPFQPVAHPFVSFSSREELSQAAQAFVNEPMDVFGPLFRCTVFELCGQSGVLVCAHHILIDGYSTQVMVSFLEQYLNGTLPPDPPGQSYDQYVEKMRRYPDSRQYLRDRQYWMDQFSQEPVRAVFSGASSVPDYTSSEWETAFPAELFERVRLFCSEQNISVSVFFCTVLGAYIHRETGHSAFTLGVPVLSRTTAAELNSLGLYMHILPLMLHLSPESFSENAKKTEYAKMDLFRHQNMTQPRILSLLREHNDTESPLFDVVFDYQSFPESSAHETHFYYSSALSVPLEIHFHSFGQGVHRVKLRYREHIFTREQIRILWDRVLSITEYALAHPDTPLCRIPQYTVIRKKEQENPFTRINDTAFHYDVPDGATVSSLFEQTARECARQTCIRMGDTAMSYGEFLTCVQALDHTIRELTAGQKTVIPIIADRSPEMYAAIYAVVRGGCAYLPVSPDDPPERMEYVLRDSGASLVLAQEKYTSMAGGRVCVNLTHFLHAPAPLDCVPRIAARSEDTAYVIYTSGSTGRPKGVCISHRSLLNRILWMQEAYPLKETGVILQKTPYTFDVSLWEIFWWGICGASMAISNPGEHFLPVRILEAINRYRITHLHFVPSVLELFVTHLENSGFAYTPACCVAHVFSSGEALKADLVRRFYALFPYPDVKLHNLYGPTECAVDVSYYDCLPTDIDPVPIGRPIYNTQLYIVDSALEPVPSGVRGQLCIAGRNVGQGYLNKPKLTAEKFIPNPFGPGKLYLTGDYAQMDRNGQILFCGRMDDQIKLNGQRIEIGEIEAVIHSADGVESAAVIVYEHNGQNLLAAIYCGNAAEETIRDRCDRHLPPYMVPSVFIPVSAMPIGRSGKLNRKALTELAKSHAFAHHSDPPVTETETIVSDVFRKVLQVDQIGRRDNFFALGGSSLSMILALSEAPLQGIPASVFLENPTPEKLARQLEQREENSSTWLHRLRSGTAARKTLVLLPYAGGSAEAYANLVEAADRHWPDCSLYFMDYPRSTEDCLHAAAELENLANGSGLYLYSHCAGSAPALQILNILEEKGSHVVRHYIAGASIPPAAPSKQNIWHTVPDDVLKNLLMKAGASFATLSEHHVADMLRRFRLDTDFWTDYFAKAPLKISCPVTLVLSRQDIFTENYSDAENLWGRYANRIEAVHYVDTPSHYFQSQQAETLIRILMQTIDKERL